MTKDGEAGLLLTEQFGVFFQGRLQDTDSGHGGTGTRFFFAYFGVSFKICTYETRQSDQTNVRNNCLSHTKRELNSHCCKTNRI